MYLYSESKRLEAMTSSSAYASWLHFATVALSTL